MDRKSYAGATLKAIDDQGAGVAVFSTLNVIDKDGDVTTPGAIGTQHAMMVPTHDWQHVPIGKGVTREEGDKVLFDFKLNLDIPSAKDWYEALKFDLANGEPRQEWSYGFDILESGDGMQDDRKVRFLKSLKVYEVSPVMLGAGEGTRTVAVKRGVTLAEQIEEAIGECGAIVERAERVKSLRAKEGRTISPERADQVKRLDEALLALSKSIGDLRHVMRSGDDAAIAAVFAEVEMRKSASKAALRDG